MPEPVRSGLDGNTFDALLHLLGDGGEESIQEIVRLARIGIRSERPEIEFVFPSAVESSLTDLATSLEGERAAMLSDALRLARGEIDALRVRETWPAAKFTAPPADVELAAFSVTRSFDLIAEKLGALLHRGDPLEMLIRGHLWLEYSINALLDRATNDASQLDRARLSFSQRVAVAAALGLIEDDELNAVRAVNRLRNRVAHELDADLTAEDEAKVLHDAGPHLSAIVERPLAPTAAVSMRLAGLIYVLVVRLHSRIDHRDASSRYERFLAQLVDDVLSEQRG